MTETEPVVYEKVDHGSEGLSREAKGSNHAAQDIEQVLSGFPIRIGE